MDARSGLYLVDKPAGPTSFGVLRSLRPAIGPKLGHAGTLDPFATGLLLVLAGRATRIATYLAGLDKRYRATVQFGAESTTLDPEGEVTLTAAITDGAAVRAAAAGLVGQIVQATPAASAVKIDGRRAYARMRSGEQVSPPPRRVRVDRLDVERFDPAAQRATIAVDCSKGTYVRQIAADLGRATGAGAFCIELRRTGVGEFDVEQAGSPEQVAADPHGRWFRTPARALAHLPSRELTERERAAIVTGRPITRTGEGDPTVVLVSLGELIALARPDGDRLQPVAVLA